ncbi:MAG: hypothetical protein EOR84_18825 [Mesorhizobium sp.]|uniref:hypothetical protein n=1 Tax=Mesorhizobium sp. TaxID=1871066 RepID=UPI000FE513A8|nr:hypothetical protein [Mesorhizobium sp.]RWM92884.1 MAG: hypothetical protein EOR84_18825 [Mesorhizobium sp.]
MYASADRISDKVTASTAKPENARLAANRQKIPKICLKRRQNEPFYDDKAALLHYGNNGAKTFRLRQDLRCGMPIFRAGSRPRSEFAGLGES